MYHFHKQIDKVQVQLELVLSSTHRIIIELSSAAVVLGAYLTG